MSMSENPMSKFSGVEVDLGSFQGGFKILKQREKIEFIKPASDRGKNSTKRFLTYYSLTTLNSNVFFSVSRVDCDLNSRFCKHVIKPSFYLKKIQSVCLLFTDIHRPFFRYEFFFFIAKLTEI